VKDDIKLMMHTVSSPNLLVDAKNIDPVLATDSWQTLMTFTRESGRESFFIIFPSATYELISILSYPDAGPTNPVSGASSGGIMDSDIPQEVLDQIAAEEASHGGVSRGSSGSGRATSGIRVCPHCTFENDHGGTDCEVCGLPLA